MRAWEVKDYLIAHAREMRTRPGRPCPQCGRTSGNCLVSDDGNAVLCPKGKGSGSEWAGKRFGQYGYFYLNSSVLDRMSIPLEPVSEKPKESGTSLDSKFRPEALRYQKRAAKRVGLLASQLGVSTASLVELGAGWNGRSWTFPERDEGGWITAIALRLKDGKKLTIRGGRRGLTYSERWRELDGPVLIVEGQTDTASGVTLGLPTIGRPSNIAGGRLLVKLLRGESRKIIVLGERDQKEDGSWPGMDGMKKIGRELAKGLRRSVDTMLLPDAKDLRVWLNAQGIDVESEAACAEARKGLLQCL